MDFEFSWDDRKAAANLRKHGVSFPEASTVFDDPFAITYPDPEHSTGENRHLTFGASSSGRVLVISHIETKSGLRIISARKADRSERKIYEQG
jgi:uncharacterized DUF497 family protein